MIKDMEYLEAIIEAENNPKKSGGGLELGPVPISGKREGGKEGGGEGKGRKKNYPNHFSLFPSLLSRFNFWILLSFRK